MKRKQRKHRLAAAAWLILGILVLLCGIYFVRCLVSPSFAERQAGGITMLLRSGLASLSRMLPFSLAEVLVVGGTVCVIAWFLSALFRALFRGRRGAVIRMLRRVLYIVILLACLFIPLFGVCYRRVPVETRMSLDISSVTDADMHSAAAYLLRVCDADIPDTVGESGSEMPYSFAYMTKRLEAAFNRMYTRECPTYFSVKKVLLSKPLTYTHISGMYLPFTGESNVNVNYPDYVVVYSAAHEMAHHIGAASEDEANLIALVVCLHADDAYIRYAGALAAAEYLLDALPAYDAIALIDGSDARVREELAAYTVFFDQYRGAPAAVAANAVNDTYLKSQGVADGTKNYDRVSLLAAAYIKQMLTDQGE